MFPRQFFPVMLFSVLILLSAQCAFADTAKGISAMRDKDYQAAFEEFSKKETALDVFYTGWFTYFTSISTQTKQEGLKLLEQAAEQDCAPAQFYLGRIYRLGRGTTINTDEARKWLEQAQTQGYLKAQLELKAMEPQEQSAPAFLNRPDTATSSYDIAQMYENGTGVDKNLDRAISFYEQAARSGSVLAMHKLAMFTISGQYDGIPDMVSAQLWMKEAHQAGNSHEALSSEHLRRQYIQKLEQAAEQGDVQAQISLGDSYRQGVGTKQDFGQALKWYSLAADKHNSAAALNRLGMLHIKGQGTEQNDRLALEYFQKAADMGNAGAQNNLARMLETGRGTEKDIKKALAMYDKAAKHGIAQAQYGLARLYGQEEPQKAFFWCQRAARQGYTRAQLLLSALYIEGKGVEQNPYKAYVWTAIAAKSGNQQALKAKEKMAPMLDKETLQQAEDNAAAWHANKEEEK